MSSKLICEGFEKSVERIVEQPLDEIVALHLRFVADSPSKSDSCMEKFTLLSLIMKFSLFLDA